MTAAGAKSRKRPGAGRPDALQAAAFVLGGALAGLLLSELGLRLAGWAYRAWHRPPSASAEGAYRILCLGESTTFGGPESYPAQLESLLNRAQASRRYRVINEGVPGVSTTEIVEELDEKLAKHRPDMVVAMMGINNELALAPDDGAKPRLPRAVRRLRVFKLVARALQRRGRLSDPSRSYAARQAGLAASLEQARTLRRLGRSELGGRRLEAARSDFELALRADPHDDTAMAQLALALAALGRWDEHSLWLSRARAQKPDDVMRRVALGNYYENLFQHSLAEEAFQGALESHDHKGESLQALAGVLEASGRPQQAFRARMEHADLLAHRRSLAFCEAGESLVKRRRFLEADRAFRCGARAFTEAIREYRTLASDSSRRGLTEAAEVASRRAREALKEQSRYYVDVMTTYFFERLEPARQEKLLLEAIRVDADNAAALGLLGEFYLFHGRGPRAEALLKRAAALDPGSDEFPARLSLYYRSSGRGAEAESSLRRADAIRRARRLGVVARDYRRLTELLRERGIPLLAVQYPMRSAAPLRALFEAGEAAVVDNQAVFQEAVRRSGFAALFLDSFGGEFGHCTPAGNRLLAESVARAVLAVAAPGNDIIPPAGRP